MNRLPEFNEAADRAKMFDNLRPEVVTFAVTLADRLHLFHHPVEVVIGTGEPGDGGVVKSRRRSR